MVSKDQAIGVAIFAVCALVGILYVLTLAWPQWLTAIAITAADADVRFWVIAVPVLIAFVAIMGIGAWIGWTMATTPPPKPIEELTSEMEEKEEKKEEPVTEPEKIEEEKKPEKTERKRKEEKP
jgi:predicted DNA-binding transcriptional regulator